MVRASGIGHFEYRVWARATNVPGAALAALPVSQRIFTFGSAL